MTEDKNEEIEIKSSFDSLLGLDIVEQLHSDLRIHIMRNMKDDSKSIDNQYDSLINEKEEIVENLERLENSIREKPTHSEEQVSSEIEDFEAKITKIGGGFASKARRFTDNKINFENPVAQCWKMN